MNNIPSYAFSTFYAASNGKKGTYHVWPHRGRWIWDALGNNGECDTEHQAAEHAKSWIRDGKVPHINSDKE